MFLHIADAKYVDGYRIWIRFNTGEEGLVDLSDELQGEMFEPLRNVETFRKFKVDQELETVVWDNGADLAPEFLHELLQKAA